jgi:outer membrane protein assembly factor BamB
VPWSSPAVVDDTVYLTSATGELRALDAASGELRWSSDVTGGAELVSSPAVAAGVVYLGDANGVLYAVDAATGEVAWHVNAGSFLSAPAVVGGVIYVGGDDGVLRAFGDPADPVPAPDHPTHQPRSSD